MLHAVLNPGSEGSDQEFKKIYGLGRIGLTVALFAHSAFLVIFWLLGQTEMAIFNVFSVILFAWAARRAWALGDLRLPVFLGLLVEPQLHAILATYYMGFVPFFWGYFIFPVMLLPLIPFYTRKTRIALSFLSAALFVLVGLYALVAEPVRPLPLGWNLFFFVFNATPAIGVLGINAAVFEVLTARAEKKLAAEHARSEALLYNLLPEDIATRLKLEPDKTIADSLPQVAILFADIVDFTPRAARMAPEDIVDFLNRIFTAFDELAEQHGLEKIKTIGDAYMVAAGMPNPCGDPVHRVAEMALDMLRVTHDLPDGVEVRIGLHAGPAVAGVIGNQKLFYDVWGETVNTASRMEIYGAAGRVQVTQAAKRELENDFLFERRGTVSVKGMGNVETWWLLGPIPSKSVTPDRSPGKKNS